MAHTKTTKPEPAPPTSIEVPPPLPPRSPELDFTDGSPPVSSLPSATITGAGMFDDSFSMSAPPTAGSGFGSTDMFGNSFTSGPAAPQPPPGDSSWISF